MKLKVKILLIILSLKGNVMAKSLNIFFGNQTIPPYHVHASASTLSTFNAAVMGRLIRQDEDFQLRPELLESFHFDFDKEVYVLKLKDDLKFHNGRKATSKDLEFSLVRGFYSSDRSFFHVYLGTIKGIEGIEPGGKFQSGVVEGVKVIDEQTVEVKLIKSNPAFFHTLTSPYFSIFPIEELENDYLTWKDSPVGLGKFKVEKTYNVNETVISSLKEVCKECVSKVVFHSKRPEKSDIEFYADKGGDYEVKNSELAAGVRILSLSNKHPLSQDINFKKGLNLLIDQSVFQSNEMGIHATTQLLPKHFWGRLKDTPKTSTSKAKEYFSKIDKELLEPIYEIPVFSGKELARHHKFYAEKLMQAFHKVGFKTKFVPNTQKFIQEDVAENSPLYMFNIVSDYVDPLIMFSSFKKDGHEPYYRPTGKVLDRFQKLYDKTQNATTFDERNEHVKKLSEFVRDEVVVLPLAEERTVYHINPKTVKDLGVQSNPITLEIENIRMK